MLIGTQTDFPIGTFGISDGLKLIADSGFDALDYSLFIYRWDEEPFSLKGADYDRYFERVLGEVKKNGLFVNQTHSPFPTYRGNAANDAENREIQARTIRATALLESKYVVIHPAMEKRRKFGEFREEMKKTNIDMYSYLADYLKEYDVYCCIENMFSHDSQTDRICPTACTTAEEMCDYIDTLNDITHSDRFVACLDIGHANLIRFDGYEKVNPVDMIYTLGDRLKTLHVHDNYGVHDDHMAPRCGNIDWKSVMEALRDIGYSGVFNLEADATGYTFGKEAADITEPLLRRMAEWVLAQ